MNGNRQTRPDMTLQDVFRALLRHRKKAMAFFLFVMTATVLVTLLTPKAFVSESKLFVRLGRENAMLDATATLGNNAVVAIPASRESEINSVAEMLGSRGILEEVVDQLGPELILDGPPPAPSDVAGSQGAVRRLEEMGQRTREWLSGAMGTLRDVVSSSQLPVRDQAIEHLAKELEISPAHKSNVVCVSYEAQAPQLAQEVVAAIVNSYLEQHVSMNRPRGTNEFFAEQANRLGNELKRLEDELTELKTTTGLASVDEQRSQLVDRVGRLEDELLTAEAAQTEAQAKARALEEKLARLPKEQVLETSTGLGNQGTDLIREGFFALQVKEKEAATIYTADHPKLQMIREELAEAERILNAQEPTRTHVKTAPDVAYEQTRLELLAVEPELAALTAKTESLKSQLAEVRNSLSTLNANDIRIARLTREIELHEADYRKYAANLEQARIDHAMEAEQMSNISIVQPASLEPRAVRPRKALNLALGLIVAVFGAFGVALLSEYVGHSIRMPEERESKPNSPTVTSPLHVSRKAFQASARE